MNDHVEEANALAAGIEAFITLHPIVFAWIVATIGSWVLTSLSRLWVAKGPNRKRNLQTLDVAIAASLAALMMFGHADWRVLLGVSLTIGGLSPFAYFGFSELLCWKWPQLRKYLSLREFTTPASDDSSSDHEQLTEDTK